MCITLIYVYVFILFHFLISLYSQNITKAHVALQCWYYFFKFTKIAPKNVEILF